MRKGWQQRKIHENAWGLHFTRWYIVAPSGNHYCMYRGAYFKTIFLEKDHDDCHKSERIGRTYQEGLKHIYELEASGNYDKKLSDAIKNSHECQRLFAAPQSNKTWFSMPA